MTNENSPAGTPAPRRQRMGVQPAASPDPPDAAPAQKQNSYPAPSAMRQNTAPAAPVKVRMGSPTLPTPVQETGPVTVDTAPPARSRMGTIVTPPAVGPSNSTGSPNGISGNLFPSGQPAPSGAAAKPVRRRQWVRLAAITIGVLVSALAVVLCARWMRTLDPVQGFIATYDGYSSQPDSTPLGLPTWLGWQHFFNTFLMVLIVRTGLQVRTERKPAGYWTPKKDSFFSPKGNSPKKVSLTQWLHQSLDVLWVLNGLVFGILLFATGQWMRIVPTSWDIVPNMLSTAIQYASLDWPTENGWVHYNALQVVAYCVTVFIAAPLAIISGLRISTWWPEKTAALGKAYPVEWARSIHVPVMVYFVAFTVVHVFLVFFTGALRNLNHMFTSRDAVDWWGLVIFLASVVAIAGAWFLTKPLFITPVAGRMGKVSR